MKSTVDKAALQMKTPSERPPFHQQLSPRKSLEFWMQHRYDKWGQAAMQGWTPLMVAQLDAWLAHAEQALMPQTQGPRQGAFPIGAPQGIISRAMSQENREYGQPGSSELSFTE